MSEKHVSYILKTDGTEVPYAPANGKSFTLAEMQKAVGGYIEHHRLPDGKNWIVINEDGVLNKLPPNDQATVLASNLLTSSRGILGDVLICPLSMIE